MKYAHNTREKFGRVQTINTKEPPPLDRKKPRRDAKRREGGRGRGAVPECLYTLDRQFPRATINLTRKPA